MSRVSESTEGSRAARRQAMRLAGMVGGISFLAVVTIGIAGVVYMRVTARDHERLTRASAPAVATTAVSTSTTRPASAAASTSAAATGSAGAMTTVEKLAGGIGVRKGGGADERKAADYVEAQLKSYGYSPVRKTVALPDGGETVNVYAARPGSGKGTVVVGAHLDSKSPSPGGNDSAAGCAVTLELARDLARTKVTPTVTFVFFGTEEMVDSNPDHHHYGSRGFVKDLSKWQRDQTAAMISLDMVGWGRKMVVRSMENGSQGLVDLVQKRFAAVSRPTSYLKDTSDYGWSDHEAFEAVALPAVWLQWWDDPRAGVSDDPVYHTADDDVAHVQKSAVAETGRAVRAFLADVTQPELDALLAR
jgi:hypothetical protein